MPTIRLTDVAISSLKTEDIQADFYCERTPRFGVRVTRYGTKTFFVFVGTPRRRENLGRYPLVSLQDARLAAKRLLIAPRMEPGNTPLREAFGAYSDQHLERNCKPRTAKEARRLIGKHLSGFMSRPIGKITKAELTRVIGKQAPSEANHLFGVLRTFFAWCERHDLLARSPVANLSKPHREKSRERVLSDFELARIWTASGNLGTFGKIVRLLILTAQRKSEIAEVHPSYLHEGMIIWPSTATKNAREHALPVSPAVQAMASELAIIVERKRFTTWSKPKRELDLISGVTNWTLHGLRRTAATGMAKLRVAPHVVERILNHASGTFAGVAGIYNRFAYAEEMRAALAAWEHQIYELAIATDHEHINSAGLGSRVPSSPLRPLNSTTCAKMVSG